MSVLAGCPYCGAIRRFILAFALGGAVAWQLTGAPPLGVSGEAWRGLTTVALLFMVAVVGSRVHQMRRRWRR